MIYQGELHDEYNILFRSLFKDSSAYKRVVELLADETMDMTREEIMSRLPTAHGVDMPLNRYAFITYHRSIINQRGFGYMLTIKDS